jgi:sugar phosphate isomerase/epimerase
MTDSQIEWIKKELNEYNLKLVVYGVLAFDSTQESMRPIFIFSKKLGIKVILAEPSLDDFKLIEKMAQEYDIKVAIHNHPLPNKYAIPQTVLDHIQGLDNHVGACPDIGHWMRSGIQPIEGLQLLKGYLLHIHLTDLNDFGKKNAYDVPLGAGKANIKEILNELAHQNYNGFLSIDYLNEKEAMYPEKSIIKSLEYFRKISMNQ